MIQEIIDLYVVIALEKEDFSRASKNPIVNRQARTKAEKRCCSRQKTMGFNYVLNLEGSLNYIRKNKF
ncbi:hypothetical protein ACTHOQ_02555 [Solibacillus silvestris]|uniref:hypothetical protein n=1 Tax=Solibacillus silvestris TaxID=76853 RepID=UPI003F813490